MRKPITVAILMFLLFPPFHAAWAWNDETHVAIAKAAGYQKWFNAAGADMIKVKAGPIEKANHFANNPRGTVVTAQMVLGQVAAYNRSGDPHGHGRLYGAIIAAIRDYLKEKKRGKYGEYHLAFAAHYIGDLSQPLHNILYDDYNRKHHAATDAIVNAEVLDHLDRIKIHEIHIRSEADLAREIARLANRSMALGYRLEDENRMLTRREAYTQLSQSASLFKAVLRYVGQ
jgi:hypothetical protein